VRRPELSARKRDACGEFAGDCRPEHYIQLLVDRYAKVNEFSAQQSEGNHAEQIILDVDVDGSRYLLVRMPKPSNSRVQLSPRENEIVRMVALGYPNKMIADVLSISVWTVCTHLRRIFAKLGVGSRAAMVARMHDLGLHPRSTPA